MPGGLRCASSPSNPYLENAEKSLHELLELLRSGGETPLGLSRRPHSASGFDLSQGLRRSCADRQLPPVLSLDQSLGRGLEQSLGRGLDRSLCRAFDQSLNRAYDQSLGRAFDQSVGTGLDQGLARAFDQSVGRGLDLSLSRSQTQTLRRELADSIAFEPRSQKVRRGVAANLPPLLAVRQRDEQTGSRAASKNSVLHEQVPGAWEAEGSKLLEKCQAECMRLRAEASEKEEALTRSRAECKEHVKTIQEQADALAKFRSTVKALEAEVARLLKRSDCKDHELKIDRLQRHLQEQGDELSQARAAVKSHDAELARLRSQHAGQIAQLREDLQARQDEVAALKARERRNSKVSAAAGNEDVIMQLRASLSEKKEETSRLSSELHEKTWAMRRLESETEKALEDCAEFVRRLGRSSSAPVLLDRLSFESGVEVLGMGHYGFVITCTDRSSGDNVVVKLMSDRWAGVAIQEWAHGSQMSGHPHIVRYIEVVMHRDNNAEISRILEGAFADGSLSGKRPVWFPDCYMCLALEYMDRGTVDNMMQRGLLTPQNVGAITQQVASALAFMHKQRRTHNDIKPENVLLRLAPSGDHLVAKLADLGLADHSTDRSRDFELFGYTVWCLALGRRFERCPSEKGSARADALGKLQRTATAAQESRRIWSALAKVVGGMWQKAIQMADVEDMPALQGLTIADQQEHRCDMMASAKLDVRARATSTIERLRSRRRAGTDMDSDVSPTQPEKSGVPPLELRGVSSEACEEAVLTVRVE
mmetsp:Transcript_109174/g.307853  ORF Transcript_109174/g.307853 Transcript_109174/m.307853 type:complete len:764 (-) Transcript_109174:81-2372(-)